MANRVIKDSIWTSKSLARLRPYFQDQWPRWLLMSDDWGCFDADPEIICGLIYPKRRETQKNVLEIRNVYHAAGQLFVWIEGDREFGFFVNWDKHQFVGGVKYDDGGKRLKHRRKTPNPPKDLLDKYLQEFGTLWNNMEHPGTKSPIPNPIPNPIPKPWMGQKGTEWEKNKIPPSLEQVKTYCKERNNGVDPNAWMNHYQAKGWLIGKSKMKDWKAAVRTWERNGKYNLTPAQKRLADNIKSFDERHKDEKDNT